MSISATADSQSDISGLYRGGSSLETISFLTANNRKRLSAIYLFIYLFWSSQRCALIRTFANPDVFFFRIVDRSLSLVAQVRTHSNKVSGLNPEESSALS